MPRNSTGFTDDMTCPTEDFNSAEHISEKSCGLVLVWSPPEMATDDRAAITRPITIGRSSSSDWCIRDKRLSRAHFSVAPAGSEQLILEDLGSRNGVFINGSAVRKSQKLCVDDVVRAGRCVFVVVSNVGALVPRTSSFFYGAFFSGGLSKLARIAARTGYHIIVEGESGVGKELMSQEFHSIFEELGRPGPLKVHNSAYFANEDDAVASLFGVSQGAFTGVKGRSGLLEGASGGTFFLDEVHALPLRVQQAFLRFIEDGVTQPLGTDSQREKSGKRLDIKLIFGTNRPLDHSDDEHGLAPDFLARLYRFKIQPLRQRRADIPSIFLQCLKEKAQEQANVDDVINALKPQHIERLCLEDYRERNVRELMKLAALVHARIAEGDEPIEAIENSIKEIFGKPRNNREENNSPMLKDDASIYEKNQVEIIALFHETGGNLSKMESELKSRGFSCSRRWLAKYLDEWGVRPIPRRK